MRASAAEAIALRSMRGGIFCSGHQGEPRLRLSPGEPTVPRELLLMGNRCGYL